MSAATASVADVSRTDFTNENDNRARNNSGVSQGQCTPMPLPALGTQRIVQGNGTNVGTVISLQCPDKHRLIGSDVVCVMDTNNTHWVGETYCRPLSPHEDFGFRVAVLASIVSSAIILLMSMAFITCCLVSCVEEGRRKKHKREMGGQYEEERVEQPVENRSRYSHKGRNNNNNTTTQEKVWDDHDPVLWDNKRACRYPQHYPCGLTVTPSAPLPGRGYDQPLLPPNSEREQNPDPPQYVRPSWSSSGQSQNSGLVQISALGPGPGLVWQYGGHERRLPVVNQSAADESYRNNTNSAKELSIRIISV